MDQSFPEKCGRVQAGLLAVLSMFIIWLPGHRQIRNPDNLFNPPENFTTSLKLQVNIDKISTDQNAS
jgi:hypothetical protein